MHAGFGTPETHICQSLKDEADSHDGMEMSSQGLTGSRRGKGQWASNRRSDFCEGVQCKWERNGLGVRVKIMIGTLRQGQEV